MGIQLEIDFEEWRPVHGYEDLYEVSDKGRVRSMRGNRNILKPGHCGSLYNYVTLCKDGELKKLYIHRMVAEAFIPNPDCLPQVNHIDENKTNNTAANLEWCTAQYNNTYNDKAIKPKERKRRAVIAWNPDDNQTYWFSTISSAESVGFNQKSVWRCLHGLMNTHKGFRWFYEDDVVVNPE